MPIRKRVSSLFNKSLGGDKRLKSSEAQLEDPVTPELRADFDTQDYQARLMGRMPGMTGQDEKFNRIIVPVSYIQGGQNAQDCILNMPRGDFGLKFGVRDFRTLSASEFNPDFVKSHVALCLPEDMQEIGPQFRTDYDMTAVKRPSGIDVELLSSDFTRLTTLELLGPDKTRECLSNGKDSGEFVMSIAKDCKDSYDCIAKTVQTGDSPVREARERIRVGFDAYVNKAAERPSMGRDTGDLDAAARDIESSDMGFDSSGPDYI